MDSELEAIFAWSGAGPPPLGENTQTRKVGVMKSLLPARGTAMAAAQSWQRPDPSVPMKCKKDVKIDGTNQTSPLESIKDSGNEPKMNPKIGGKTCFYDAK
jgi:hypothetical protein